MLGFEEYIFRILHLQISNPRGVTVASLPNGPLWTAALRANWGWNPHWTRVRWETQVVTRMVDQALALKPG